MPKGPADIGTNWAKPKLEFAKNETDYLGLFLICMIARLGENRKGKEPVPDIQPIQMLLDGKPKT
jgi:hypothetical protein